MNAPITRHDLTERIKEKARALGFTSVGVTSAEPFDEATSRLASWVERGAHGLMSYMERNHDKRRDVSLIVPNAKSIVSLAMNYNHPLPGGEQHDLKISRYAWGTDYHEVIPERLAALLDYVKEISPGASGRYYTDTGPLHEKAIAERAGIGWIGKHTNVITREVGSWVFLAEIILDIELEYDTPASNMCGTCTRCIDACPTDALIAPYQLDATRCIPYLTIELKAQHEIPDGLSNKLEGWLYGCDICQEVCPWNRFEKPSEIAEFSPRAENLRLSAEEIEQMEPEEFSMRFRKSPIKRTKLAGLKRTLKALTRAQKK